MRRLIAIVTAVLVVACASRHASTPTPTKEAAPRMPMPITSARAHAVAVAVTDAGAPAEPDSCPPLQPNEVSNDETPSIMGTSAPIKAGDWLAARGVSKAAFRTFVRSRDPRNLDDFDADSLYDGDESCPTLTVGDKSEDALVCTLAVRTSIMRYSAVAFVVRSKRIAPVLEVGYALPAMDWPDARWLDLQVSFLAGGLAVDVHDRAKPGAVLVSPPSYCRAHVARHHTCERAHREGSPLDDVCPQVMDASGKTTFGHWPKTPWPSPMGGDRAELRGCAEALPKLDELVKETTPKDIYAAEFRADRAFAVRSCEARGHYVWKGNKFVRAVP